MRDLTPAALAAISAETTKKVFAWLVEISHPDMEPIRLTDNTESIESNGETYDYWPFHFSPPEDREQNIHTATLVTCNVDPEITRTIRALTGQPIVTISMVMTEEPDDIIYGPVAFQATSVQVDRRNLNISVQEKNVFIYASPWQIYTPQAFPGFTR